MKTELEMALNKTNFVICEFEPDPNDICESCKTKNLQLYYRRTDYWENEGEYFCKDCIVKEYRSILNEIEKFETGDYL